MTTSTVTIVGDVSDLIGNDYDPSRTKVWVQHNTDKVVTDSGPIRLGAATKAVSADGTFSFANVVASTSLVENLQATLWVDWPNTAGPERTRRQVSFGPYDLTGLSGTVDIRTLEETQALDPVASSALLSEMQDLRDEQVAISGIDSTDTAVAYAVQHGAITPGVLSASFVPKTGGTLGGALNIQEDTARPPGKLDNDPNNSLRISADLGANALTVTNYSDDVGSVAGITFWDGSTGEHGGDGREVMAIGYSVNPANGVFGGKAFLEVSNDPFIGSLTDAPKDFVLIQTGFISGPGYGPKVRFAMDGAGHLTFSDVNGVGQLHIGPTGGHVDVLTKLSVGSNAAPDLGIEIHEPTAASGIRIHDTTTSRSTYLTNGATHFGINATGGNGMKLSADGLDFIQSKAGAIGVFGQVGTGRVAVNGSASDAATTLALVNQIRAALIGFGWLQ